MAQTPSGGIEPRVLVELLEHLEDCGITDRHRIDPAIICDGHGSRLALETLLFIRDKSHIWNVLLGLPNGTKYWQVHDDKRMNGHFKQLFYKAKARLLQIRQEKNLPV